ncbi:MAG: hypothetical protein DRI34_06205 [Deltaproteobacteria bacterium]|nr:MAG: hypothetical protein DRI34_06205 [Deltaproteobacteria bacterium]
MIRNLLPLLLAGFSGLLSGCGPLLMLGEKSLDSCEGYAYDDLRGRLYRLERLRQGVGEERTLRFDLSRSCQVPVTPAIKELGIKAIRIADSRGSSPRLELELSTGPGPDDTFICRAALDLEGAMTLSCPAAAGVSYRLTPRE